MKKNARYGDIFAANNKSYYKTRVTAVPNRRYLIMLNLTSPVRSK